MAENNTDTIDVGDELRNSFPTALQDNLDGLILNSPDDPKMLGSLSFQKGLPFGDIVPGRASEFHNLEDKWTRAYMLRHISAPLGLAECDVGNTAFQHQRSEPSNGTPLQLWQKMCPGSRGLAISVDWSPRVPKLPHVMFLDKEPTLLMTNSILPLEEDLHSNAAGTRYLSNQQKDVAISVAELLGGPEPSRARNPNNGAAGILFQYQRSEPSAGTPLHYIAARHSADVAISAAGRGTPPYHHTTGFHTNTAGTDLAISVAGSPSVPKPSHATVLDYVTNLMKEISVSLNGNPQLARDHPKWFTTLLGINGGVIITLISKSTSNNPQSLSTEIMESFTALSAVVGFSASLAGLYLITNKPQTLPVSCDSEVATPKMGIVGGIATAFAFMAGVLLLLPNNPFRWITLGLASAAFLIPVLIKLLR